MSKRILIVEDEKNLARFVSLELQHEGYDVVTADNGREGLEMALEKDFDLILLDLMLPEMDGFEDRPALCAMASAAPCCW